MTDTQEPTRGPEGRTTQPGPIPGPRVRRRLKTSTSDKQRRKKLWTYSLLAVSALLMVNSLFGEKGYLANLQARQEFHDVSTSLQQLKDENARLAELAKRMKTDPRALEDSAREQLGLIKPGETLITLRDRPATRD
jgi:cell division protein FtsB